MDCGTLARDLGSIDVADIQACKFSCGHQSHACCAHLLAAGAHGSIMHGQRKFTQTLNSETCVATPVAVGLAKAHAAHPKLKLWGTVDLSSACVCALARVAPGWWRRCGLHGSSELWPVAEAMACGCGL